MILQASEKGAQGRQAAIADYALIGDTRAAALISRSGGLDWLCLPRFDAEPAFGVLVDPLSGGRFAVAVGDAQPLARAYRPGTASIETTWRSPSGRAAARDALVVDVSSSLRPLATLVRSVECTAGQVQVEVEYVPRFGLPGTAAPLRAMGSALVCEHRGTALALTSDPAVDLDQRGRAHVILRQGERWTAVLAVAYKAPLVLVPASVAEKWMGDDERWWKSWADDVVYDGRFREAVVRSLITLRLLTFSPSGAVVASPTTSLPETLSGGRNWDYRYAWPRDASLASGAFTAAGKLPEARSFLNWLIHTTRLTRPRIQVLYTLDGTAGHREREVPEVAGYLGSRPVRVGNAAAKQHQLDVYGWVVDAGWHLHTAGQDLDRSTWGMLADFADFARDHWPRPDAGIWEVRGEHRHYTSSKLMAWLALDRAVRMAEDRGSDAKRRARWRAAANELCRWVLSHCLDGRDEHLVQAAGLESTDASVLLLGMTEMVDGRDRLARETIAAVRRQLEARVPGLLYRYPPGTDGLAGDEGCFVPCSFWLVEALARAGQVDEAEELMGRLLKLSSEVGLYAEEMSPDGAEMLGNAPLAFSHAALVRAAFAIEAANRTRASRR